MVIQEDRLKLLLELTARPNKPSLWKRYVGAVLEHRKALQEGGNTGQTFTVFSTRKQRLLRAGAREADLVRVAQFISGEDAAGRIYAIQKYLEGE